MSFGSILLLLLHASIAPAAVDSPAAPTAAPSDSAIIGTATQAGPRAEAEDADELDQRGHMALRLGDYTRAEKLFKTDLALRLVRNDREALPRCHENLARLYAAQQRIPDAVEEWQRSLAALEQVAGPRNSRLASRLYGVASQFIEYGRFTEATRLLQRAEAVWRGTGRAQPMLAQTLETLARNQERLGQHRQARAARWRAVAVWDDISGPGSPQALALIEEIAEHDLARRAYEPAQSALVELISRLDHGPLVDTTSTARLLIEMKRHASSFRAVGRDAFATSLDAGARRIRTRIE